MNDAIISEDQKYRYLLRRETGVLKPNINSVLFVMLNPSTADATNNDPTIRRCIGFAKTWGAASVVVANLYAYRATAQEELWAADDPIGPDNVNRLAMLMVEFDTVVCAWGGKAKPQRVQNFMSLAKFHGCKTCCLVKNKDGSPKHPLYIKADQELINYELPNLTV